jgi:phosphomannomutase
MKKIKNLIVFDLDGTLANGDSVIDTEMADLLNKLLEITKVAVISGSDWPHFEKNLLSKLPEKQFLKNLIILPISGTKYYQYRSGWKKLYTEDLTIAEKKKVIDELQKTIDQSGLKEDKIWGEQIQDRGSQITFSALGKLAPIETKKEYDKDLLKRKKIKAALDETLPGFSVQLKGLTSIDITKVGIDKAFGIYKLHQILDVKTRKMLFVGNALFEGGNDHAAINTGVECIGIKNLDETKRVIETIIACLNMEHKKRHESV